MISTHDFQTTSNQTFSTSSGLESLKDILLCHNSAQSYVDALWGRKSLMDQATFITGYATLLALLNPSTNSCDIFYNWHMVEGGHQQLLHISGPIGMNELQSQVARPLFLVLPTYKGLHGALQ